MEPTKQQLQQIKMASLSIGMYVSKKNIARIIQKWEELRNEFKG